MSIIADPRMREWEASVPRGMRDDVIWRFHAYRVALFMLHLSREDARHCPALSRGNGVADQLIRAVASVSANIADGYRRSTPRDRTRFYDIALGSLREATRWYEAARPYLPGTTVDTRLEEFTELRRLLFGVIRALRKLPSDTRIMS